MILEELLEQFELNVDLPEYLYSENFNLVFKNGRLEDCEKGYKIVAETRTGVTHILFIIEDSEFPVVVNSVLKNGAVNGFKFGRNPGELEFVGGKYSP